MIISLNPNSNNTFNAQFIQKTNIKQKRALFGYKNKAVSLVKLQQNSLLDKNILDKLAADWNSFYVKSTTHLFNDKSYDKYLSVYALTEQEEHHEYLDKDKVLGIMTLINQNDTAFIEYLNVNPKYTRIEPKEGKRNKNSKYKNIGTSFLNFLKNTTDKKYIRLFPAASAIPFYIKNGFKKEFKNFDGMIYYNKTTS